MSDKQKPETMCVTCGDAILPERVELGYTYCTKQSCVRENREGLTVVEIAQNKTNPEYVILDGKRDERVLRDVQEGKYRRDPVVVKREKPTTDFTVPPARFARPKARKYQPNRVKFVQALADQGYRVDEIVQKGAYMNLTRSEVIRYMSGRRPGGRR
jgi:hypothetical protein